MRESVVFFGDSHHHMSSPLVQISIGKCSWEDSALRPHVVRWLTKKKEEENENKKKRGEGEGPLGGLFHGTLLCPTIGAGREEGGLLFPMRSLSLSLSLSVCVCL